MEVLKISSKSPLNPVARAIASVVHEGGTIKIQAVGAGASNQIIKAITITRGYLMPSGISIIYIPAFASISIDGGKRTAVELIVEPR